MQTINAATIHAQALALAAIAPEYDPRDELHSILCASARYCDIYLATEWQADNLEAATFNRGERVAHDVKEAHEWARAQALEETAGDYWHAAGQLPARFVTIQTSERGRHKVRNNRARLVEFAAQVKANQKAFGGGIKPTRKAQAPAIVWPAQSVKVARELMQDRAYADALQLAESKCGALFYDHQAGKLLFLAPVPVAELPGMVCAMRASDGHYVVFEPGSGLAMGSTTWASRARSVADAVAKWESTSEDKRAAALAGAIKAKQDQAQARAAWMMAHGLADAIEAAQAEALERAEAGAVVQVAAVVAEAAQAHQAAAGQVAAVVATAQALATAQAPAIAAQVATACAGAGEIGAPGMGHAAGQEGPQGPGAGRGGHRIAHQAPAASQGVQDLEEGAADSQGVQDLDQAAPTAQGVQDLDAPAPAIDAAGLAGDISVSLARAAYHGTSWTPERRGDSARAEYGQTLAQDYATFYAQAVKGGTLDKLAAEFDRYRAGMAGRYRAYLASSSRCVSSWIAGPSNFPAARMNKRADIAHRRLGEYLDGRTAAMRAVIRNLRPDLRPIMAGDADAADRLAVKIDQAERLQDRMKAANAAIRKHRKAGEADQVAALVELGFIEAVARELLKGDSCGRIGFADYELQNNGANIRRMQERLAIIERNQAAPVIEAAGADGVRLEDDPPANRVRLYFPGKPAADVRDELKAAGFRWAPSVGAWQGYRNHRTMTTARRLAGLDQAQNPAPAAIEADQVQDLDAPAPVAQGVQDLGASPWALQLTQPSGVYVAWACSRAAGTGRPVASLAYRESEGVQDLDAPAPVAQGVQDLDKPAPITKPAAKITRLFVPELGQRLASKSGAWEAWFYRDALGRPCLVFYRGKAQKPTKRYWCSSDKRRMVGLMNLAHDAEKAAASIKAHADERKAAMAAPHGLQVGAVLVHTWGYDQTNQDFYQVVGLFGKRGVQLREIEGERHYTGDMSGNVVPCPDQFKGEATRHQVRPGDRVKVGHGYASSAEIKGHLPSGQPVYRSYSFSNYN